MGADPINYHFRVRFAPLYRCSAVTSVPLLLQESPKFPDKKGKVVVWFIMYLMQNVYKFILLFPKTSLFLLMLLVCGRCHLYLRMDVCMCRITSHIW